jgi:hypothetical protein
MSHVVCFSTEWPRSSGRPNRTGGVGAGHKLLMAFDKRESPRPGKPGKPCTRFATLLVVPPGCGRCSKVRGCWLISKALTTGARLQMVVCFTGSLSSLPESIWDAEVIPHRYFFSHLIACALASSAAEVSTSLPGFALTTKPCVQPS